MRRTLCLAACFAAAIVAMSWQTESRAANSGTAKSVASDSGQPDARSSNTWDQKAAAAYLDQRAGWWMEWPRAARDHGTFCVSCHTAVPYAMSRPLLRGPLAEQGPSANEQQAVGQCDEARAALEGSGAILHGRGSRRVQERRISRDGIGSERADPGQQ